MSHKVGEYKGHKILSLYSSQDTEQKYPFSFGLSKAKMILDELEVIKNFVGEHMPVVTTTRMKDSGLTEQQKQTEGSQV